MQQHQNLEKRKYLIGMAAVVMVIIYLIRLFTLQIMSDDFKRNADSNAFMKKMLYPARGLITDRKGRLLVYNEPAYNIMVIMNEQRGIDTLDFCRAIGITRDEYIKRMKDIKDDKKNPGYSRYTPQLFMSQIPANDFASLQEKLFKYKGFYVEKRAIRHYATKVAAHILGDVGEVSPADVDSDKYYRPGDYIGKLGLERSYEKQLRGTKGMRIMLRDVHGTIKGHYMNGAFDRVPEPGKTLTLGIDRDLQALGERLMKGKIGSIVAIDPTNGEVLCMVSSPTFDPHLLTGPKRGENFRMLRDDPHLPMLNRAIMGVYPPGSTFKTSQVLTFLQEGIVTPSTQFSCNHGFYYGNRRLGCHGHASPLSMHYAIQTSCNSYFCNGFSRMMAARQKYGSPNNALTVWKDHMVAMGFGYCLGIDLPGEKRGLIPNAEYYDRHYTHGWNGLTIVSNAIGQGEVLLTPLQIANLGATIANRGFFYTPHVVHQIEGEELDTLYTVPRYTHVERRHYEEVVRGMRLAVTGGTCREAGRPEYEACGKTGTAENRGRDHSVFMGFAPMNNPKIAIAVYVENGGFGAKMAVPIGGLIMEHYLNGGLSEASEHKADDYASRSIDYGTRKR